jgi:histone H3/H4
MIELMKMISSKETTSNKRIKLSDIIDLGIEELDRTDPDAILLDEEDSKNDDDSSSEKTEFESEESESSYESEDDESTFSDESENLKICKQCFEYCKLKNTEDIQNVDCDCECHTDEFQLCDNGYETDEDKELCEYCQEYDCECSDKDSDDIDVSDEQINKEIIDDMINESISDSDDDEYKDYKKQEIKDEIKEDDEYEKENEINTTYMMISDSLNSLEEKETIMKSFVLNSDETIGDKIRNYLSIEEIYTQNTKFINKSTENMYIYSVISENNENFIQDLEELYELIEKSIDKIDSYIEKRKKKILKIIQPFKIKFESLKELFENNEDKFSKLLFTKMEEIDTEFIYNVYSFLDDDEYDQENNYFKNINAELQKNEIKLNEIISKFNDKQKNIYLNWEKEFNKTKRELTTIDLIQSEQRDTSLIFPKHDMKLLISEITQDYNTNLNFTDLAFEALQTAAEDYLISCFQNGNLKAINRNSSIVESRDIKKC